MQKKQHCNDHCNEQQPVHSDCLKSSSVLRKNRTSYIRTGKLDVLQEEERGDCDSQCGYIGSRGGGWGRGWGTAIKSRKLNCFLPWNKFTREDKAKSFGVLT